MRRLLSRLIPNPFDRPVKRWHDPDVRGPMPDVNIDSEERMPLTRPSSPRPVPENGIGTKGALDTLPLEIRQQIWEDVIGRGRTFHLVMAEGRIVAPECRSLDPGTCNGDCRQVVGPRAGVLKPTKKFLLPLLLTSRQIYSETVDILYFANIFETQDVDILEFLPLLLLPQRINAIRSLRFTWRFERYPPIGRPVNLEESSREEQIIRRVSWITVWDNIAAMQHLQTLQVRLNVRDIWWGSFNQESAQMLLEPIKKVTIPKTFILSLPFPPDTPSPYRVHSWSADKHWQGVDPWDELPCAIRRVSRDNFIV